MRRRRRKAAGAGKQNSAETLTKRRSQLRPHLLLDEELRLRQSARRVHRAGLEGVELVGDFESSTDHLSIKARPIPPKAYLTEIGEISSESAQAVFSNRRKQRT